jgi:hypothetical protein
MGSSKVRKEKATILAPAYDRHGRKTGSSSKNKITRTNLAYSIETCIEGEGRVFKEPVTYREEIITARICPSSHDILVAVECLAYTDCRSCSISCFGEGCVLHDVPAHEFVQIMCVARPEERSYVCRDKNPLTDNCAMNCPFWEVTEAERIDDRQSYIEACDDDQGENMTWRVKFREHRKRPYFFKDHEPSSPADPYKSIGYFGFLNE